MKSPRMPTDKPMPAWQRRRFKRLGLWRELAKDDELRRAMEPRPAAAEHVATRADLRAMEEAERHAD